MRNRTRALVAAGLLLVAIAIISLTIGRTILSDRQPGLSGFSVVHFAGYLFFLLMPVEALVPIYLAEGHSGALLVGIALVTAIAAQTIDYGIGHAVSGEVIDNLIGTKRYERAKGAIHRYGHWAVLFFNLLPLSSPNLLLVAGVTQYSFRKTMMFSFIGLSCKYVAIVYLTVGFGGF